jgi:hypothetical protein
MHTTPCDTFYEFWQAWYSNDYPKQSALMAIFQNSIDYRGAGDVNADGIVDIFDAILLSSAIGSRKGEAKFDKRADLNYDDIIDIFDATILANNAGKIYDC